MTPLFSPRALSLLGRQAAWLGPKGHHSCGAAPESHRTSLLRPLFRWGPPERPTTQPDGGTLHSRPILSAVKRLAVAGLLVALAAVFLKARNSPPRLAASLRPHAF